MTNIINKRVNCCKIPLHKISFGSSLHVLFFWYQLPDHHNLFIATPLVEKLQVAPIWHMGGTHSFIFCWLKFSYNLHPSHCSLLLLWISPHLRWISKIKFMKKCDQFGEFSNRSWSKFSYCDVQIFKYSHSITHKIWIPVKKSPKKLQFIFSSVILTKIHKILANLEEKKIEFSH